MDYNIGDTIVLPENITDKKYYSFVEWSPSVPETMPEYDMEFTAVYEVAESTKKVEFYADDELYWSEYRYEGESINIPETVPTKVGYTFVEWTPEVAETMPDENLIYNAIFTPNIHQVTFVANGETYYSYDCAYNESVILPETEPTKEGYTFEGWLDVPDSMPNTDVEIVAVFEPIVYTATFTYNGVAIGTDEFTVEDDFLDYPIIEEKAGYDWVWEDHQINAGDLTVNGDYVLITYTATFIADGQIIKEVHFDVNNQEVIAPDIPHKDGYTYSWEEYEVILSDITINSVYTPIEYTAIFKCNGEIIGTDEFTVEDKTLDYPVIEEKAGYDWVWEEHQINAGDLTVNGDYALITYTATFVADGEIIDEQRFSVIETEIINPDIPNKNGYTGAWENYEIQLADFTVNAIYTPITYTAIFMENGNIIGTDEFTIEDTALDYPEIATKDHYNWQWDEHKIAANDLTVSGAYTPIKYKATFVADDVTVAVVEFDIENQTIINPDVPEKEGYTGEWQSYTVSLADFEVVARYDFVRYTATFTCNGNVIGVSYFTINSSSLDYPEIAFRQHYDWVWEEHEIIADNITINGDYVPTTYTIKFVSNGRTVKTQSYNVETVATITAPALSLSAKTGYHSEWEKLNGRVGNITLNEIYVPNNYTANFWHDGNLVRKSTFNVENKKTDFTMPSLPERSGYEVLWSDFDIVANDIDIYAEYVPIVYTATFIADGKTLSTQNFTVESEGLTVPELPQKAGYIASWDYFTISAGDKLINANYYLPEANMISKRTLEIGDTYRLMPICNFTPTGKVWTSSDISVATVDDLGVVTVVGEGDCKITVTCYGKDSLGNEIQATTNTKIVVNGEKDDSAKTFREMFDEFFEVTLHDILYNFKAFLIVLFKYAY